MRLNEDYFNDITIDSQDSPYISGDGHTIVFSLRRRFNITPKQENIFQKKFKMVLENISWIYTLSIDIDEPKNIDGTVFIETRIKFFVEIGHTITLKNCVEIAEAFGKTFPGIVMLSDTIFIDDNPIAAKNIHQFNLLRHQCKQKLNIGYAFAEKRFIETIFNILNGGEIDPYELYKIIPTDDDLCLSVCDKAIAVAASEDKEYSRKGFNSSEQYKNTNYQLELNMDMFNKMLDNAFTTFSSCVYTDCPEPFIMNMKRMPVPSMEYAKENPKRFYMGYEIRMAKAAYDSDSYALVFPFKYVFTPETTGAYCMVIYGMKYTLLNLSNKLFKERKP